MRGVSRLKSNRKKEKKLLSVVWSQKALFILIAVILAVGYVWPYLSTNSIFHHNKPIPDCTGSTDFKCWRDRYQLLVAQQSAEAALADAKAQYDKGDGYLKNSCHQITHVIGRAALKRYHDLETTFGHGNDLCASGYYHGTLEAVAAEIGPEKIKSKVPTICAPLREKAYHKLSHFNCVHGLGHGLMAVEENQLFKALKDCDALSDKWEQDSCYGGVFMENVMADINPGFHTDYLKPSDVVYPCDAVDTKYKDSCYFLQTSYMLKELNWDFNKVFALCANAHQFSDTCYQSLGRDVAAYTNREPVSARNYCLLGKTYAAQTNCLAGAVKNFVWEDRNLSDGDALCVPLTSDRLRKDCLSVAKTYYATFD